MFQLLKSEKLITPDQFENAVAEMTKYDGVMRDQWKKMLASSVDDFKNWLRGGSLNCIFDQRKESPAAHPQKVNK